MEFTVQKNDLVDVLSQIQSITGRKSNLAITTSVLIQAKAEGLLLTATDLDTGYEGLFPAQVRSEGSVALNAKKLYEIVSSFAGASIEFNEGENHWINIFNEKIKYHLVGMNPDDFPEVPKIENIDFFTVDSLQLKKGIEKVIIIGAAPDDRRAHIAGVLVESLEDDSGKHLRMLSTDGSRLAKMDVEIDAAAQIPTKDTLLVPKKGLADIIRFLENEGPVQIGFKENHLVVQKQDETIVVRLLEGDFPQYSGIIEKTEDHQIVLDRQLFMMMLKRMSILATDDYRGVIFNFNDNRMEIHSTNPDMGESKEDMDIAFNREEVKVAFNPKFFIDALHVIDDENVIINLIDDEKPCQVEGDNDKRFLTVIMPMRI